MRTKMHLQHVTRQRAHQQRDSLSCLCVVVVALLTLPIKGEKPQARAILTQAVNYYPPRKVALSPPRPHNYMVHDDSLCVVASCKHGEGHLKHLTQQACTSVEAKAIVRSCQKLIKCTSRRSFTLARRAESRSVIREAEKFSFCSTPRKTFEMTRDVNNVIFATVNKSTTRTHVETLNNAIRQRNKLTKLRSSSDAFRY
jgi:hypothetical protein